MAAASIPVSAQTVAMLHLTLLLPIWLQEILMHAAMCLSMTETLIPLRGLVWIIAAYREMTEAIIPVSAQTVAMLHLFLLPPTWLQGILIPSAMCLSMTETLIP